MFIYFCLLIYVLYFQYIFVSCGMLDEDLLKLEQILDSCFLVLGICFDVVNGYFEYFVEFVKIVRNKFLEYIIIVCIQCYFNYLVLICFINRVVKYWFFDCVQISKGLIGLQIVIENLSVYYFSQFIEKIVSSIYIVILNRELQFW